MRKPQQPQNTQDNIWAEVLLKTHIVIRVSVMSLDARWPGLRILEQLELQRNVEVKHMQHVYVKGRVTFT